MAVLINTGADRNRLFGTGIIIARSIITKERGRGKWKHRAIPGKQPAFSSAILYKKGIVSAQKIDFFSNIVYSIVKIGAECGSGFAADQDRIHRSLL